MGSEGLNLVFQPAMSRSPLSPLFPLSGLLRAGNLGKVFKGRGCQGQQRAVGGPEELSEKLVNFGKRKLPMKAKAGNMPGAAQKILTFVSVA